MSPRFVIQLSLLDKAKYDPPLHIAVEVDDLVRITPREVEEMKLGLSTFEGTVALMKRREFRKELFIQAATKLGTLLAERMEDAEGWHDTSRVEPAREQLGGKWE